MKPIHKLNNGRGATLCHTCSVIISTGLTKELYCNNCIPTTLKEKFIEAFKSGKRFDIKNAEVIADDFAIDFAEWIDINYFVYNTWDKDVSIKELLEIYKKEKGL
jgi:hypothetical protein